jgi:hypothetical protein
MHAARISMLHTLYSILHPTALDKIQVVTPSH